MVDTTSNILELGNVAFYWRMRSIAKEVHPHIPASLPFSFAFNPKLQLIIEASSTETLDWLSEVYKEDQNVGYLQEGHALSQPYGTEFLRFVEEVINTRSSNPHSFMDIGCGGVYMLKLLKERGFDVYGVDPSPVTIKAAECVGIPIIPEFYPFSTPQARIVDVIYHHNVLEHVSEPEKFLSAHHANLAKNGLVLIAVPDCSEHISRGDISMRLQEHLNYFDQESLKATVEAAGFDVLEIKRSAYGGVLYCAAAASGSIAKNTKTIASVSGDAKFDIFYRRASIVIGRIQKFIVQTATIPNSQLGIYVPLRAMPYVCSTVNRPTLRFFDDDPGLKNRYFDGFDLPVEDFEDFVRNPPSHLLIASYAFDEQLKKKVIDHFGDAIEICSLRDFTCFDDEGIS